MESLQYFKNPYFTPKHQLLHQTMNPVLKMLSEVSQSSHSFMILWDEDYQQLHDSEINQILQLNIDKKAFETRFSKLMKEVIYVSNIKLHTLFQGIDFFKRFNDQEQLLLYPIVNAQNKVKGIVSIVLASDSQKDGFHLLNNQMESIGSYVNLLYQEYGKGNRENSSADFNMESLPVSFFEIEINQEHEVIVSNFSKNLIRKHFASVHDCAVEERVKKILNMPIRDFYGLINKGQNQQCIEYVYGAHEKDGKRLYFLMKLHVKETRKGTYKCCGVIEDFTINKAYDGILEQIIFDISHIMRRPVVTMKGLTNLIDIDKFDKSELIEISKRIKIVSEEMEQYIKAMLKLYEARQHDLFSV